MALEEKELPEENNVQKNESSLSNEIVDGLLKKISELEEKINQPKSASTDISTLRELVEAIKGTREDSLGYRFENNYLSNNLIDESDVLSEEEWVTFISNTVGYVITDDLRNGQPIRVPYGVIEFKFDSAKEVKNGKESDIFNISKYVCKSRKELDFLRKHSGYRFFHFENIKGAKSVNAQKAIKMQTVFKSLQSLGQHQLINLAHQHDIPIPEDIFSLRGEIAFKIVDEQILKERNQTEQLLSETKLESEIVAARAMNAVK